MAGLWSHHASRARGIPATEHQERQRTTTSFLLKLEERRSSSSLQQAKQEERPILGSQTSRVTAQNSNPTQSQTDRNPKKHQVVVEEPLPKKKSPTVSLEPSFQLGTRGGSSYQSSRKRRQGRDSGGSILTRTAKATTQCHSGEPSGRDLTQIYSG